MIHFVDKVLENLRPYVPLLQTLVWPLFLGAIVWCFRRHVASCVEAIRRRIETGSSVKAGMFEIGGDLRSLEYAAPQQDAPGKATSGPTDWVIERTGIYRDNSGLFLTHVLAPSERPGQKYDVFIYLIRHKTKDMSDIERVEFFFGHMWGNQVFSEEPKNGRIGVSTSAYGPFLCTCRVHLRGGAIIRLHRYIDFEMGRMIGAQEGGRAHP